MRVIGVVDLLAGRAVHARAGRRETYEPVRAAAGEVIAAGDAVALARIYVDRLGITELYVADLDAIIARLAEASRDLSGGATAGAGQGALVSRVATLGAPLWLDAGTASADDASRALELGAGTIVVGLETLPSFDALEEICARVGGGRVAFSLDLRDGGLLGASNVHREAPHVVAARAAGAGASAVIVIDLARVGTSSGLDVALVGRVRDATPGLTLLAGGGVRGGEDLGRLADAGCDGALVATALHDGRIGAAEIAAAKARQRSASR